MPFEKAPDIPPLRETSGERVAYPDMRDVLLQENLLQDTPQELVYVIDNTGDTFADEPVVHLHTLRVTPTTGGAYTLEWIDNESFSDRDLDPIVREDKKYSARFLYDPSTGQFTLRAASPALRDLLSEGTAPAQLRASLQNSLTYLHTLLADDELEDITPDFLAETIWRIQETAALTPDTRVTLHQELGAKLETGHPITPPEAKLYLYRLKKLIAAIPLPLPKTAEVLQDIVADIERTRDLAMGNSAYRLDSQQDRPAQLQAIMRRIAGKHRDDSEEV